MRDDVPIIAILCKAWSHGLMREWFHHTNTMQFGDKWSQYAVILSWLGVIVESVFVYLVFFFHMYDLHHLWWHVFCKASMLTMLESITDSPCDNLLPWCDSILPKKSKLFGQFFSLSASIYPTRIVMTNNMCDDVQICSQVEDVRWYSFLSLQAHECTFHSSRITLCLSEIIFLFSRVIPNTLGGKGIRLPKSL